MTVFESVNERGGSPSVEAAIIAAVIGVLIAFAIAGGRLVTAEAAADHAARAAARIASLQRDPASARAAAQRAAQAGFSERDVRCVSMDVTVDISGFAVPIGTPASVKATARCSVSWSDLGLPGVPGTRMVEGTFLSPIDRWRERP